MRWEGAGENHSSYTSLLSVPSHGQVFLASGAFTLVSSPFWTPPTPSALHPLCFSRSFLLARAPTDSHTFATLTPVPAVKGWKGRDMPVLLARVPTIQCSACEQEPRGDLRKEWFPGLCLHSLRPEAPEGRGEARLLTADAINS